MPAHPPESDDAMVRARAVRAIRTPYAGMTQIRFAGVISAPHRAPRYRPIYHRDGATGARAPYRCAAVDTERKRRTISGRRLTAITGLSMRNCRKLPSPRVRQRRRVVAL